MNTSSLTTEGLRSVRDRIIASFVNADSIYVDTCTLIEKPFADFVKTFGPILLNKGKKLIIIHQVYDELNKLATSGNTERNLAAMQALQFIKENAQYFQLKKEFRKTHHADRAFCKLLAQHCLTRNQIFLTEDYQLTAAIYNLCSCDTDASSDHCTRVLTLMNGYIPRQRTAKQLKLDSCVEFSFWPLDAQPVYTQAAKTEQKEQSLMSDNAAQTSVSRSIPSPEAPMPRPEATVTNETKLNVHVIRPQNDSFANSPKKLTKTQYFEALIRASALFMTHDKLVDIFIRNNGKQFIYNLHELHQCKVPVVIGIMKNALDAELEEKMAPWMHLFKVLTPLSSYMSETHALLSHIGTRDPREDNNQALQNILISDDEAQFEHIRKRLPGCHAILPLMRGCIAPNGDLHSPYKRQQYSLKASTNRTNYII